MGRPQGQEGLEGEEIGGGGGEIQGQGRASAESMREVISEARV